VSSTDESFVARSRAIAGVVSCAHLIFRDVTRVVRPHKLTESQYNALRILRGAERRDEHLTQAELADRLIASRANTTWILDRLEERKLIARRGHEDRRKNIVEITAVGSKLLLKIDPEFETMLANMLGHVPQTELDSLLGSLSKFKFD
jgi:DNA-binding MarR family transcriptional regulator